MIDDTEIAYIAGLFDGEGHVGIGRMQRPSSLPPCYTLNVAISNTHLPVLEELQGSFGGKIWTSKGKRFGKKPVYVLRFRKSEADKLLRLILPYLRIKKVSAEYAIQFLEMPKHKGWYDPVPIAELDQREMLKMAIKNESAREFHITVEEEIA